jgi:hypothetical protein
VRAGIRNDYLTNAPDIVSVKIPTLGVELDDRIDSVTEPIRTTARLSRSGVPERSGQLGHARSLDLRRSLSLSQNKNSPLFSFSGRRLLSSFFLCSIKYIDSVGFYSSSLDGAAAPLATAVADEPVDCAFAFNNHSVCKEAAARAIACSGDSAPANPSAVSRVGARNGIAFKSKLKFIGAAELPAVRLTERAKHAVRCQSVWQSQLLLRGPFERAGIVNPPSPIRRQSSAGRRSHSATIVRFICGRLPAAVWPLTHRLPRRAAPRVHFNDAALGLGRHALLSSSGGGKGRCYSRDYGTSQGPSTHVHS